jgi:hypothetical protein
MYLDWMTRKLKRSTSGCDDACSDTLREDKVMSIAGRKVWMHGQPCQLKLMYTGVRKLHTGTRLRNTDNWPCRVVNLWHGQAKVQVALDVQSSHSLIDQAKVSVVSSDMSGTAYLGCELADIRMFSKALRSNISYIAYDC